MTRKKMVRWLSSNVGWAVMLTSALIGGALIHRGHMQAKPIDAASAGASITPVSLSPQAQPTQTRNIENIRVGDRVLAHNPQISDEERAQWQEPDWQDWWHLSLEMPVPARSDPADAEPKVVYIELLRPTHWVQDQLGYIVQQPSGSSQQPSESTTASGPVHPECQQVVTDTSSSRHSETHVEEGESSARPPFVPRVPLSPLRSVYRDLALTSAVLHAGGLDLAGLTVELDLPEMGAIGTAIVTDIRPSPPIHPGDGQVVTATFKHPPSARVLDVTFAESISNSSSNSSVHPLGVTENHLFWSVDRQDFIPIGKMSVGERVLTYHGETRRIAQKLPRPGPQLVYNLEVDGEHVYFVGINTLLAHNECWDAAFGVSTAGLQDFAESLGALHWKQWHRVGLPGRFSLGKAMLAMEEARAVHFNLAGIPTRTEKYGGLLDYVFARQVFGEKGRIVFGQGTADEMFIALNGAFHRTGDESFRFAHKLLFHDGDTAYTARAFISRELAGGNVKNPATKEWLKRVLSELPAY